MLNKALELSPVDFLYHSDTRSDSGVPTIEAWHGQEARPSFVARIRRPRLILAFTAALVLLAVPGLGRPKLRPDGKALVPADDPAVQLDAAVRQRFHLRDPIVVVVRSDRPTGSTTRKSSGPSVT